MNEWSTSNGAIGAVWVGLNRFLWPSSHSQCDSNVAASWLVHKYVTSLLSVCKPVRRTQTQKCVMWNSGALTVRGRGSIHCSKIFCSWCLLRLLTLSSFVSPSCFGLFAYFTSQTAGLCPHVLLIQLHLIQQPEDVLFVCRNVIADLHTQLTQQNTFFPQ